MENVNIIPFNEVEAEEISWLFYPYIAYGKVTLLGGEAGCGKTMVALALASILSNGGKLPLQTEETERQPRDSAHRLNAAKAPRSQSKAAL